MTQLTQQEQEANLLSAVRIALDHLQGADYQARRNGVIYIATILGHKLGVKQLRDQTWGTVGQCANCDQIAKAPRVGDSIEGRATYTICPAGRSV